MKQGVFFLTIAALVALLAPVANVSAQADPMSVLQHFVDARNEADEAGVMTLVADDVSIVDGSACLVENQCVGRQALRAHVQLFVADKTQTLLISPVSVSDATITVRAETSSASIRAAGVDRIVSEYTADIRDGRLTSLRVIQDASDRQTAEFQAFRRARPTHSMVVPEPDRARRVVGVPYRDVLQPAHLTYTDVVTRPLGPMTKAAAAGVSLLQGSNPQVTLGPYGPAIAYTVARYVGTVKHLDVPGADDPKVIASATRSTASCATEDAPADAVGARSERGEPRHHGCGDLVVAALRVVALPLEPDVGDGPGDGCGSRLELLGRAEGVAGARHEEAGQVEVGEVRGAHAVEPAGRVQRIAEQHQPGRRGARGDGQGAHPASHRAPAQHHVATRHAGVGQQRRELGLEGGEQLRLPIGCPPTLLAVGEVHAPHGHGCQGGFERHQRVVGAVAAGARRQEHRPLAA